MPLSIDPTKPNMGVWKIKEPVQPAEEGVWKIKAPTAEDASDWATMIAGLTMPIPDGYEITLPSGVIMVWDEWYAV